MRIIKIIIFSLLFFLFFFNYGLKAAIQEKKMVEVPSENKEISEILQKLINSAEEGTVIKFPEGSFNIDNIIIKKKIGLTIAGEGTKTVLIQTKPAKNMIFKIINSKDITIRNLHLIGNKDEKKENKELNNCCHGISIVNSEKINIQDNYLENTLEHGISVYGDLDFYTREIKIQSNKLFNNGNKSSKRGCAIWLYKNVKDSLIENNYLENFSACGIGIDDEHLAVVKKPTPSENILVKNNTIIGLNPVSFCNKGILLEGSKDLKVIGNKITMGLGHCNYGITISTGQADIGAYQVEISGNEIRANHAFFFLQGKMDNLNIYKNKLIKEKKTTLLMLKSRVAENAQILFFDNEVLEFFNEKLNNSEMSKITNFKK